MGPADCGIFFAPSWTFFFCLLWEKRAANDWLSVGLDIWTDGEQNTYQPRHVALVLRSCPCWIELHQQTEICPNVGVMYTWFIGNLLFPAKYSFRRKQTSFFQLFFNHLKHVCSQSVMKCFYDAHQWNITTVGWTELNVHGRQRLNCQLVLAW